MKIKVILEFEVEYLSEEEQKFSESGFIDGVIESIPGAIMLTSGDYIINTIEVLEK